MKATRNIAFLIVLAAATLSLRTEVHAAGWSWCEPESSWSCSSLQFECDWRCEMYYNGGNDLTMSACDEHVLNQWDEYDNCYDCWCWIPG
jgi:hypothetical protein